MPAFYHVTHEVHITTYLWFAVPTFYPGDHAAQRSVQEEHYKTFSPIICMQVRGAHSDSLARSGQDWPDRLPIRPATLLIELNTVCFSPVVVLHRSAVTDTQSRCREAKEAGQGEQPQRYSPTGLILVFCTSPSLLHINAPSTL